ncbi:GNAT family N-acetyltransferase [Cellulomonas sp. P22]|uniref:GNAT family N-acetyltransferase n=1 Tax=Cellulomonas sp. P22 TaxID=3373189 RepID=UPI0037A2E2BE
MRIRQQHADEWPAVRELVRVAFEDSDPNFAVLVDRIHESPEWVAHLSLVAEVRNELVGNILISKAPLHTERGPLEALVLAEVGVLPDARGQGFGSALLRTAVRRAEEGVESVLVARGDAAYYQRFGFRAGADLGITAPSDRIPPDQFMVLPLPQYDEHDRGRLELPAYFWESGISGL